MPTCCQGATCACKVAAVDGGHISISGSGQANDPFLISADIGLRVVDTIDFDMTLNGTGTVADPWSISVGFAATAKLADFPDVSDTPPTNGQVLAWNGTSWAPAAPTTASSGSVIHNATLSGDGSVGNPLVVSPDSARMVQAGTTGVGLNDAGMGNIVRHFADATARNAMTAPTPALNALTMLTTVPGEVDYWDGTKWVPILDRITTVPGAPGSEFLQLSGPYNGLTQVTRLIHPISATTDGTGTFTVLSTSDLSGRAGVLIAMFQETGALAWKAVLTTGGGQVLGKAYTLVGGTALTGTPVTGLIDAYCY